ncbi:uncharacterized protein arhgef5 isoform X1 [Betta splendens]|uniref:Uncharacterized protein arhgef5 isoform X1 n=1 Tax=Betta splendens TaxID=158456 RepID=A0A6P7KT64_BETSP|nr:uncharacterized protein arhgef5 isoform X1 [Betta splendens]
MVQWGSKALPSLTLSNMNMPDHKLQPVGRIHRDPSPRPTMTTPCVTPQLAQERVSNREGDWGRERDKARSNDVTPHERYYHPDRATAPRWREGEREWMQSERRPGGDKSRQVRALINVKMYIEKEMERGLKKGETFPRMTNSYGDHGRRKMSDATNDDDRLEKRKRDRQRQTGPGDWERERDREWLIERRREGPKHEIRIKAAEEGIKTRRRPVEDDRMQHRERYNEPESSIHDRRREVDHSRDRREKYAARNRDMGGKGGMTYSPHRQRAVEIDTDRSEREKAQKSGQSRGTRSEGDSVERELRRERARDREKENSKSDGGNNGKRVWEGDGDRYKEDNGQRYTDRDREREVDRSRKREVKKERERYQDVDRREEVRKRREDRERRADLNNDRALLKDREDHDRYKDYRQRKIKKEREADLTWAETTGFQPVNTRAPRVPPRSVSSGEWSSDMDDMTHRRDRGGYDEREPNENKRDAEQKPKRSERHESDTGDVAGRVPDHRRMWLDPQRDKNSKEEVCDRERYKLRKERRREEESMASRTKWVGEGRQGKQDPDEHLDQCRNREREKGRAEYTGETERESEGVSVDGDDVGEVSRDSDDEKEGHLSDGNGWSVDRRTAQTDEHPPDTTEEGDGEEGGVSDRFAKAGCETPWKPQNDRTLSAEAYVTLSSDGGDEEEREEDEDEEFEDCREYSHNGTSPVDVEIGERRELTMGKDEWVDEEQQGAEKQPKYVFCVIGQTLPQSGPGDTSPSEVDQVGHVETHNPELEEYNHCSDDATRQPRGDPYLTVSRNNDDLITSEQNRKDEAEQSASKEVKTATGEAAGAEITYASPALLRDTEETVEDTRGKAEYPCPQITESNRDSQTERLLVQWRGKHKEPAGEQRRQPSPVPRNPYADVPSEVNLEQVLDGINAGVLRSAEAEAVDRSQIVKGWTLCEEPKRHSQAPHLKWAKNVVRDILGNSEEETVDEPNAENQESMIRSGMHGEELVPGAKEGPFIMLTANEQNSEPELQDEDSLEDLRGMQQRQGGTRSQQFRAFYDDTLAHTHADTPNTEGKEDDSVDKETRPSGHIDIEFKITCEAGNEVLLAEMDSGGIRQKEAEMYLSPGSTLYKPNSCPILNCESTSDTPVLSRQGTDQEVGDRASESEQEILGEEPEGWGSTAEVGIAGAGGPAERVSSEGEAAAERETEVGTLSRTGSLGESGDKTEMLRWGIRAERRHGKPAEEEEEEGVGRDRRTRIFSTTDDEGDWSQTWGGEELKNRLDSPFSRQKRKSKFFKRAQLYQQYNEAAQNLEILTQSGSHIHRLPEFGSQPLAPPPANRPLPPLPSVLHPHSYSFSSVKSLPLPEPPRSEGRPPSPRLSVSFTQSPTLWQDLPGVRNNSELAELTENQRRLQEVQFEVLTSEASYCRSLDIVVEHFVKSKQLGALLTSQDRNWLFSRLSDVRAISHSFLLKLEERVESDLMHFTVCDIIAQHCPRFKKVYVPYLTNQSYQDATYQRLMNENPAFKRIVEKLERNPVCERLPFRSFLILPFQRITRIKLLVQNIVKKTNPGTAEATQAIRAMKLLEKLIQESNDSISQMKNIESLVSLNAKVDFECKTLPLVSQSRRLIREGPVTELMDFSLKDTERNAYLHLFNDFLLVSLQKEGGRFTVIDHSPVKDLRGENCRVKLHTLQKNLFRLHMANRSLLLRSETQSDKLRWLSALSRPYPEVDFSAVKDVTQMQCIRAFVAQQPDELSLDKADIILVHQTCDNWVEGTRLPDCHRGWVPESNLEKITNDKIRERNLSDAIKLTTATAAV